MERKRVGILLFPDVELLDFSGPYEVFGAVRLNPQRRREEPSPFEVLAMAETADPVKAAGGLRILPDATIDEHPVLDVLVVPGGWGTRREMRNERLIGWIAGQGRRVETLASVCTGALLLAAAGLLDGRRATTHRASIDLLRDSFPRVQVVDDVHVVEEGRLFTSAGISAGIDLALRVTAAYFGLETARATARHMEYDFNETNERRG